VQPTPPFATPLQPQPYPVAPPPTIPDERYDRVEGDEVPFEPQNNRRSRRRRAFLARILGVLGILLTAALAFVTVGRAWVGSLPSIIWPSSLLRPEHPSLPSPLGPRNEPVLPSAPEPPPLVPPMEAEAAPGELTPVVPPAELETAPAEPIPTVRTPSPPVEKQPSRGRRPVQRETSEALPLPGDPKAPVETAPDQGMTPEELPARPTVDPASPEAPPAGEAPPVFLEEDDGNTVLGDE
jgi:hypothetical protein